MRRCSCLASASVLLVLAACSSDAETPFGIVASSPLSIGVGEQRVMFGLIDQETNEYLASPDHPATVTLRDENGAPIETYDTEFMWTVEDVRGLYVAQIDDPRGRHLSGDPRRRRLRHRGPDGSGRGR